MKIKIEQKFLNWYIPIGLIILNFILKIIYLNVNDIASDEPFSIYYAQMDISTIITELSKGNNPPFFEILLHYWIKLFGISKFSVRFLPFLFNVAAVYFIYKIGLTFFNSKIAVLSGLLFTFSNYLLIFAQEARVYSLLALLACVSMYAFLHLIKNNKSKLYLSVLIISNVLLGYAHYFGLFVIIIQLFCCLVFKDIRKQVLKHYLIATIALIILYSPNIKVVITRFMVSAGEGTHVAPIGFDEAFFMFKRFCNSLLANHIFVLIFIIALIKRFFKKFETTPAYNKVAFTWFLFPFLFMFFISYKHSPYPIPMFVDRYVIYLVPGFYISLAICTYEIFRNIKFGTIFMSVPVLLMLFYFNPNMYKCRTIPGAMDKIKELQATPSVMYICPGWADLNFVYYYDINIFKIADVPLMHNALGQNQIYPILNAVEIDVAKIKQVEQVIYIDANADFGCIRNGIIPHLENSGFYQADSVLYYGTAYIRVFKKKDKEIS